MAVFAPADWQIVSWAFVTGIDIERKLALLRAQLQALLGDSVDHLEVTSFGVPAAQPESQHEAMVAVRIAALAREREQLTADPFFTKLTSLHLWSVPGVYTDSGEAAAPTCRLARWARRSASSYWRASGTFRWNCRWTSTSGRQRLPRVPQRPLSVPGDRAP